jgi:plastocyanin
MTRYRRWVVGVLAAAGMAIAVAGATAGGDRTTASAAANVTITAHDFFFEPSTVTIQVGDTVTWTNEQGLHNVLLGDSRLNAPGFPQDPSWNPPPQQTFTTAGSYTFLCEVHPGMTGTVNVQGGGEPTPTPTATPTPTPGVPPPGGAEPDTTAPELSAVTIGPAAGGVQVGLTVSEPATINVRFSGPDVLRLRAQVEPGKRTLHRPLPNGNYSYELWAVDAMGNRSSSEVGEVRVRG